MRATGLSPDPRADLCWRGDDHLSPRRRARPGRRHGDHPLRLLAAALPPRAARRRPGRRRGPGRRARHPVDQDHGQGVRPRPRHPDGRPDHAGGPGHPRQGARPLGEGGAARPGRPDVPLHGRRLRLPGHGRHRQAGRRRPGQRRRGRHGVPERPRGDGHQARRHPGRRRGRRRRDRHGDRPGRVPRRALPAGLRGDRAGPRGLRPPRRDRGAPQGDLRDRRAADLRQRPPRLAGSA